jgi:hypothetical protein
MMAAHYLRGRLSRAAHHLLVALAALERGGRARLVRARLLLLATVAARGKLPPALLWLLRGRLPLLPHLLLPLLLPLLLWLLVLPLWMLTLPLLLLLLLLGGVKALLSGLALGVLLLRRLLGSLLALPLLMLGVLLLRRLLGSLLALPLLMLPRLLVRLLGLMERWRLPLWASPEAARLVPLLLKLLTPLQDALQHPPLLVQH